MDMKRTVFFFTLSLAAMLAHAQLTLEECQRRAQDNYPLVRQYGLIEKARGYDLSNAGKGYLPQFSLSGKATYQSDITRLPVEIPNLDIKTASKDQYQVMLEVQQTLWDGGDIRSRKRLTRAASEVELEKQHVDMYALTDRVNQLFFGILLLDEQLKQNSLLQEDLGRTHKQVADYIANGIATLSDLDAVSVEQLNTRQHRVELETTRRAYLSMLAAFTGKDLLFRNGFIETGCRRKHRPADEQPSRTSLVRCAGRATPPAGGSLEHPVDAAFRPFCTRGIRQSGVEYAER